MSQFVESGKVDSVDNNQQNFIAKTPLLTKSQDYAFLREQGLRYIEKLGHKIWTDYNVHDPGITILELLCYAITDLGYRTEHDIKDLLTSYKDGKAVNVSEFHTARDILTSSAVTFEDLRKLLIDIRGVRNVWIEQHGSIQYFLNRKDKTLQDSAGVENATKLKALNGLYDVYLEYDDFVVRKDKLKTETVKTPDILVDGDYIAPNGRGILFDVEQSLSLDSVTVYPDQTGSFKLRIFNATGRLLKEKYARVRKEIKNNVIPLDCYLPAGKDYRIEVYDAFAELSGLKLFRTTLPVFAYEIENHISLTSGSFKGEKQKPFFFLYRWRVTYLPRLSDLQVAYRDVLQQAADRLHTHRNLCEDIINICELLPEEIAVCTDIEIEAGADPDEILAEMFYRLEQHVSPVVNFYTIDELVDKGKTMEEIFEGPQLDHGFIDDEEFNTIQRRTELRSSDLINIIMDIPHVIAVKNLSLLSFIDGEFRQHEEWRLQLATEQGRTPSFNPDLSKVVFYQNGIPDYASRVYSKALIKEKKAGDLRNKLQGHQKDLAIPVGEFRDVGAYRLIQHELPMTYRAGNIAVEHSRGDLRKAQSKQLKTFMLFFEQLLVNYLAQLDHVKELFSWKDTPQSSYFTRQFDTSDLNNIEQLYINYPSLGADLKQIIETKKTALERRSRFLDHLVARFCEDFTEYSLLMYKLDNEDSVAAVNQTKQAFLQGYADASRERGQGYDYRQLVDDEKPEAKILSGYQQRVYGLLGIPNPVSRQLAGHRFKIVQLGDPADDRWRFELQNKEAETIFNSIDCQSQSAIHALLDFAMSLGSQLQNYQPDETEPTFNLIRPCEDSEQSSIIGSTVNEEVLEQVIDYFSSYAEAEGFHIIEHILLRKRFPDDPFMPVQINDEGKCDCTEVIDPYSFRLTVILPAWSSRFKDTGFRQYVEDSLRREAPAHVFLKICWISHSQMVEFETIHADWVESLSRFDECRSGCREEKMKDDNFPLTGQLKLPEIVNNEYTERLEKLIKILHNLNTVYPLARLKGCDELVGDDPVLILDHSTLGTY